MVRLELRDIEVDPKLKAFIVKVEGMGGGGPGSGMVPKEMMADLSSEERLMLSYWGGIDLRGENRNEKGNM